VIDVNRLAPAKTDCTGTCACSVEPLAHPLYSFGMLLEPRLLALEHRYHALRANTHNIRLHDFGTVCGLKVDKHPAPQCVNSYVILRPGIALDCCGREIVIPEDLFVPLVDGATSGWCGAAMSTAPALAVTGTTSTDVPKATAATKLYICLRYAQCDTDPIPTYVRACGCCQPCEHGDCTPSVTREGYEVLVTSTKPKNWTNPVGLAFCNWLEAKLAGPGSSAPALTLSQQTLDEVLCAVIIDPCADFCSGGNDLLLLATVTIAADGTLSGIDNVTGRRLVVSTGALIEAIACLSKAEIACCAQQTDGPRVISGKLPASASADELSKLLLEGIHILFTETMDPASAVATTATVQGTVTLSLSEPGAVAKMVPAEISWETTSTADTQLLVRAEAPKDFPAGKLVNTTLTITLTAGPKGGTFSGAALRDKTDQRRLDGSPATGGNVPAESGDGTQGGDFIFSIAPTS
jgi:hypothetical protein